MKCPKCRHANPPGATECESCGVQFKDLRREYGKEPQRTSSLCDFEGRSPCSFRGVISPGTQGDGPWYCREHWEVLNGRKTTIHGNAIPAYTRAPGHEARDMAHQDWLANRDRRTLPGRML